MADERLRDAERRWRESGTVDDEAAYLRERVRTGQLAQARLELAAHLGHEAAERVAQELGVLPRRAYLDGDDALLREGMELWRWGKEVATRAAIAAAARAGISHCCCDRCC